MDIDCLTALLMLMQSNEEVIYYNGKFYKL